MFVPGYWHALHLSDDVVHGAEAPIHLQTGYAAWSRLVEPEVLWDQHLRQKHKVGTIN
jgi:hypothetical protein